MARTKTSTDVKRRYNEKTYTRMEVSVKKEVAEEYKARCQELGIPYSQPLHEAIQRILDEAKQGEKGSDAAEQPESHEKGGE